MGQLTSEAKHRLKNAEAIMLLDTCALFDFIQGPISSAVTIEDMESAKHLKDKIDTGSVVVLLADKVTKEINKNYSRCYDKAKNTISSHIYDTNEYLKHCKHFDLFPKIGTRCLLSEINFPDTEYLDKRNDEYESWLSSSIVLANPNQSVFLAAQNRLNKVIKPAKPGGGFADCLIIEAYFDAMQTIRYSLGLQIPSVFVSSNTSDFGRSGIHPELTNGFSSVNLLYAVRFNDAHEKLGI